MYEFTTESGTTYRVEDGRITRLGEPTPGCGYVIVREPVRFESAPAVGARCIFRTRQDRFTTSPVLSIDLPIGAAA